MVDAAHIAFFLESGPEVVPLDLVEVSHPDFSQTYRLVRNHAAGVQVVIPGLGLTAFEFRAIRIERSGSTDDLTQGMRLDLGDPGDTLPAEVERLVAAGTIREKPLLRYWCYRSDDLSVPLVGPLQYEVTSFSRKGGTSSIEVAAPEKNSSSTGNLMTFNRFPMQRGFI